MYLRGSSKSLPVKGFSILPSCLAHSKYSNKATWICKFSHDAKGKKYQTYAPNMVLWCLQSATNKKPPSTTNPRRVFLIRGTHSFITPLGPPGHSTYNHRPEPHLETPWGTTTSFGGFCGGFPMFELHVVPVEKYHPQKMDGFFLTFILRP